MMPAINFQPRFADLVESGRKTQTIRKANRFKVGDKVALYTGQRTKRCRKLGEGVVTELAWIRLNRKRIGYFQVEYWSAGLQTNPDITDFAIADGFADAEEMVDWFEKQHGLPFKGWLIKWRLNCPAEHTGESHE